MKNRIKKVLAVAMASCMTMAIFAGCGGSETAISSAGSTGSSDKKVLRVGMECTYAPFNWTQSSESTPDGEKAVKIYGQNTYAYGYDVMVAQKIAK